MGRRNGCYSFGVRREDDPAFTLWKYDRRTSFIELVGDGKHKDKKLCRKQTLGGPEARSCNWGLFVSRDPVEHICEVKIDDEGFIYVNYLVFQENDDDKETRKKLYLYGTYHLEEDDDS